MLDLDDLRAGGDPARHHPGGGSMIAQIGIAIFGVLAVWLSQEIRIERRRWAPVFGLIGQPFWFWSAWHSEQWGIFALCFLYAASWARGLRMWRGQQP